MYSAGDKAKAQKLLDADFAADVITTEQYAREEALLQAGSPRSSYLKQVTQTLHGRAFAGDREAIATLTFRYAVAVLVLVGVLIVGCGVAALTGTEFDGGFVPDGDGD